MRVYLFNLLYLPIGIYIRLIFKKKKNVPFARENIYARYIFNIILCTANKTHDISKPIRRKCLSYHILNTLSPLTTN